VEVSAHFHRAFVFRLRVLYLVGAAAGYGVTVLAEAVAGLTEAATCFARSQVAWLMLSTGRVLSR
jgi:hypothetical protein